MPKTVDLLKLVRKHCAATGVKPSAFGRAVLGDPNFVSDLEGGRSPRLSTAARVIEFINKQKGAAQ